MCVSWCHRLGQLYWNHLDCSAHGCCLSRYVSSCDGCIYRGEELCELTGCDLPPGGSGCCHRNIILMTGNWLVTAQTVAPLGILGVDLSNLAQLLDWLNYTPYRINKDGQVYVDIDELALPEIYGYPVSAGPELPESPVGAVSGAEFLNWEF